MKTLFAIVSGLFRINQGHSVLSLIDESCDVEAQVTDVGVRVNVKGEDSNAQHRLALVPVDGEILYHLSLAVENGCGEDEQRIMFGDKTVDWVNALCEQNHDLVHEYWQSLQ
jgi:hypothetical protein